MQKFYQRLKENQKERARCAFLVLHFGVLAGYALAILVMIAGFIVTCGTHDSGGSEAEASMNTAYAVLLVLIPAVLNGGGLALAIDWSRWIECT